MKIAIIGGGNGGQAMAGHFALLGHQITLYNRTLTKIDHLVQSRKIQLTEAIEGEAILYNVTDDLEQAMSDAELIMITTTANAHRELAQKMAPYLQEGQIVVLNPGRTLGALEFSITARAITQVRFYIAEAQSLIYACRAESNGEVRVIGVKDKVLFSAYPSTDTDHAMQVLNSVYNCFIKADSILTTGLENIGAIFHPTVILFNAASIERGEMFYFYNDMTPSVAEFLEKIDAERVKIGEAFGIKLHSVSEWVSFAYRGIEGNSLCEKMRNNPAYFKIKAPNTLHSRLLLEDVPTGILPFVELAKISGVSTPLLSSVLMISESLLNKDFRDEGRTLENLGLLNLDLESLKKQL